MTALLVYNPWSNGIEPQEKKRDEFASDRSSKASEPLPFDGKRAIGYLEELCKIGPRISGTDGMTKQQKFLEKHFEDLGGKVSYQRFTAKQNSQRNEVEMANMVVSWFPEREKRVIICSHYDTRPIADQEPDRRKWHDEFVSANDGGSGVVIMMEMAHAMKDLKTNVGVDFVFFDGEEYVFGRDDLYFFGSKHFAADYRKNRDKVKFEGAVLLDMVGGKNAHFAIDPASHAKAGKLVEEIWSIAVEQKCDAFLLEPGEAVEDDHLALQRASIKAIDIIEWPNQQSAGYEHWHRLSDTPDKCSAATLTQVAKVLGVWLQRVK
jgi:glutaminyl-peptide cyclotransferase